MTTTYLWGVKVLGIVAWFVACWYSYTHCDGHTTQAFFTSIAAFLGMSAGAAGTGTAVAGGTVGAGAAGAATGAATGAGLATVAAPVETAGTAAGTVGVTGATPVFGASGGVAEAGGVGEGLISGPDAAMLQGVPQGGVYAAPEASWYSNMLPSGGGGGGSGGPGGTPSDPASDSLLGGTGFSPSEMTSGVMNMGSNLLKGGDIAPVQFPGLGGGNRMQPAQPLNIKSPGLKQRPSAQTRSPADRFMFGG